MIKWAFYVPNTSRPVPVHAAVPLHTSSGSYQFRFIWITVSGSDSGSRVSWGEQKLKKASGQVADLKFRILFSFSKLSVRFPVFSRSGMARACPGTYLHAQESNLHHKIKLSNALSIQHKTRLSSVFGGS